MTSTIGQSAASFDAIVFMGVCGCGKSTVGQRFAQERGWAFLDADDFHPPANVAKMKSGAPLDDDDRRPWLNRLNEELLARRSPGQPVALACSALKKSYRDALRQNGLKAAFVYLEGTYAVLEKRLNSRQGHFMAATLLRSQLDTLEEPQEGIRVSIDQTPDEIAADLRRQMP